MFWLTLATVIFAFILIFKGSLIVSGGEKFLRGALQFLYYRPAAIVLWLLGVVWTLVEVTKLGPADFGSFKGILFVLFAGLGVASLWMLRDYLVVRAVALLSLFICWWFLKTTFLQPPLTRLLLVLPIYLTIIAALALTVAPWRMRDFFQWLLNSKKAAAIVGWGQIAYGALLLIVAATYRWVA